MNKKIIRTICKFTKNPSSEDIRSLDELENRFISNGFVVQTKRLCAREDAISSVKEFDNGKVMIGIGSCTLDFMPHNLEKLLQANNVSFNMELNKVDIGEEYVNLLFEIIKRKASKTFNFAFAFNNASASPFFPSANSEYEGISIGLQATDLAEQKNSLQDWLDEMKDVWNEIIDLMKDEENFLGIDSSIAPLSSGSSSFVNFIKRIYGDFNKSFTSDFYTQITKFIKEQNLKPVGLCGLMMPCLEDFELAKEYEKGNFTIERNIFVSLHSGLGIDTYPIGVDEDPKRVIEILKLVQALSNKYNKPLSARFVSDGVAKIGERTNFQNPYLYDVNIRPL